MQGLLIPGDVLSALNLPGGCRSMPIAANVCKQSEPLLSERTELTK